MKNLIFKTLLLPFFICVCLVSHSFSQPALPVPDGLGFFWNISASRIQKINLQGEIVASFSNLSLGKPGSIDASDPFRVMIFFRESQFLVFLNSEASIIGKPISIADLGLGEVPLACRSSRGGFWLFHREGAKILHFDDQLKRTERKIFLDKITLRTNPSFMIEHQGIIYVGLEQNGISLFDIYGTKLDAISIQHDNARFENKSLWLSNEKSIFRLNLNDLDTEPEVFPSNHDSLPLTVGQDIMCFDGEKFILFIKNL